MSALEKLTEIQDKNKSMICLGLDLDAKRMPAECAKSIKGMYEFAMNIIEATKDCVCAYKPNMAFYENMGHEGLSLLESILNRMPSNVSVVLDGKRGDIGNTASFYAEAMFKQMNADWVTLNPYMGYDALRPFLEYKNKGIFVLCLTSNTGSKDFQLIDIDGKPLYRVVAEKVDYWNKEDNCGLVVGATQPEQLKEIRSVSGDMPLLIPGVGAQGGSLEKAAVYGTDNFKKSALINVSRSVLYASNGDDYAERAREEVLKLNSVIDKLRSGDVNLEEMEKERQEVEKSTEAPKVSVTVPEVKKELPTEAPAVTDTPNQADDTASTTEIKIDPPAATSHQEQVSPPPPPTRPEAQPATSQEQVQSESRPPAQPGRTPAPMPTPPPPLQANPDILKRNRENAEKRQEGSSGQPRQGENRSNNNNRFNPRRNNRNNRNRFHRQDNRNSQNNNSKPPEKSN